MNRAEFPAHISLTEILPETTEPAPITVFSPILILFKIIQDKFYFINNFR